MPREIFPVGTPPEVLAAWLAEAQAARYVGEIELPIVRRPKAEPPPPMDSLFEKLPIQKKGERARPEPPPAGTPLYKVVGEIFEGVIAPPSPLAEKRRERRVEREAEAKAAARGAKAAAKAKVEADTASDPDAIDKLVAAGITTPYLATLGSLKADDTPYSPRSLGFPVKVHVVGGPFGPKPWSYELHLSTPACGDLPFVRKVEEVTGLKARWVGRALGQWHHAVDLANDAGWERLASSMEHTEPGMVADAVGMHVGYGELSVANGRRLLLAVGVDEPGERSYPNLRINPHAGLVTSLGGWEAIHAVEDGLITPDARAAQGGPEGCALLEILGQHIPDGRPIGDVTEHGWPKPRGPAAPEIGEPDHGLARR